MLSLREENFLMILPLEGIRLRTRVLPEKQPLLTMVFGM
jgi:hypothetical protein